MTFYNQKNFVLSLANIALFYINAFSKHEMNDEKKKKWVIMQVHDNKKNLFKLLLHLYAFTCKKQEVYWHFSVVSPQFDKEDSNDV